MENTSGFREHMHTSQLLKSSYAGLTVLQPIGYRVHVTQGTMQTLSVVEHLDVVEDVLPQR